MFTHVKVSSQELYISWKKLLTSQTCANLYLVDPLEFLGKYFINFVFYTVLQGRKSQTNTSWFSLILVVMKTVLTDV